MNKSVRVILLDGAEKAYEELNNITKNQKNEGKQNTDEIQLLKSIDAKIELIKKNPFYGDNIEKKKIPIDYKVHNLWRVKLTKFWRMLYTIKGDQIEIICFVLDILNHKEYDKKFKYEKK
jgi:Txe/YoeB family toxin of Txe-Axe toxin-antitoxin module